MSRTRPEPSPAAAHPPRPERPAARLLHLDRATYLACIRPLVALHLRAMGYDSTWAYERRSTWTTFADKPGFRAIIALNPDFHPTLSDAELRTLCAGSPNHLSSALMGVAICYRGSRHDWWHEQVLAAMRLRHLPSTLIRDTLSTYTELAEIHVEPHLHGQGVGLLLLSAMLDAAEVYPVLLSTPEDPTEQRGAWRLYRRFGFRDVLRCMRFYPDTRDFAVLAWRPPAPEAAPPTPEATPPTP